MTSSMSGSETLGTEAGVVTVVSGFTGRGAFRRDNSCEADNAIWNEIVIMICRFRS